MYVRALSVFMATLLLAGMARFPIASGQEKEPYSLEEVENLIQSGEISDQRIREVLYANGLDFYPGEEAIARLKRAGASAEVIEAVRTAEHPPAPSEAIEEKEPFYKQWWFLGAAAFLVGVVVALGVSGG